MPYNCLNQFRCDIVRTRAKRNIDDLLPAYATIIDSLCPCPEKDFIVGFNGGLAAYLKGLGLTVDTKSLNNHRTETAKTLFGMYYIDKTGTVQSSERTKAYLKSGDQPAFFKDFCYKLQFPNGMTKDQKLKDRVVNSIEIYPYRFALAVLQCARNKKVTINIRELGYYVFNSLDVLQGLSTPDAVVSQIKKDQNHGIKRDINTGKNRPRDWEHIEGLVNYLELANLIVITGSKRDGHERTIRLNTAENTAIHIFVSNRKKKLVFDVKKYVTIKGAAVDISKKKDLQNDWDKYNAEKSDQYNNFFTSPSALGIIAPKTAAGKKGSTLLLGNAGEAYVLKYEQERLAKINPGYASYVKDRSGERGIGFDIESIIGTGSSPLDQIMIEVKTTSRVTEPHASSFMDMVNMTRNEWTAAEKNPMHYYLYRVYLIKKKVIIYIIGNVKEKETKKLIDVSAPTYEVRFDIASSSVVDEKQEL